MKIDPRSLTDAYEVLSKASNLQVGDTVEVVRAAKTHELGWDNAWTDMMDQFISGEYEVVRINHRTGIDLAGTGFSFPFFILELIEPAPIVIGGYKVETMPSNAMVNIGNYKFSYDTVRKLYRACFESVPQLSAFDRTKHVHTPVHIKYKSRSAPYIEVGGEIFTADHIKQFYELVSK